MRRLTALVLVAALQHAAGAAAQAPAADEGRSRAMRLSEEASQLFAAKHFTEALEKFQQAYGAFPSANLLFNVGRSALEADQPLVAAESFEAFLDQTTETPALHLSRAFAEEKLLALRRRIGRLRIDPTPSDAVAELDGTPMKTRSSYVMPGQHRLKVSAPGYAPIEQLASVAAGEDRTFTFALVLESQPQTQSPPERTPPLDALAAPPVQPAASSAPWLLLGAGGASFVVSGVFGVLASANDAKLQRVVEGKEPDAQAIDVPALRSAVRTQAWTSTAALGVGVLTAGVGAVLLWTRSPDRAATLGADASGLALRF